MDVKKIPHALECLLFIVLLFFCLLGATRLMVRKESINRFSPFLKNGKEYDVLFTGNSRVVNGIYPMELWEKYGIASYNIAANGNTLPVTYWTLMNALDYSQPRLVVVDMNDIDLHDKVSGHSSNVHTAFDCFPLRPNKIRAIYDLMDLPGVEDFDGNQMMDIRWEYLLTLGKYHSRWSELSLADVFLEPNKMKGGNFYISVFGPEPYEIIDDAAEESGWGFIYLRKIIEACQERGIDILLINLPYPATLNQQICANTVEYVAQEYGIPYLNFVNMDQIADYTVDLFDPGHLNPSGARKATDFLGDYIRAHYPISDRRGDAAYSHWDQEYAEYLEIKKNYLRTCTDLNNALMLLHDEDFNCCIHVPKGASLYDSDTFYSLMQNIAREHIYERDAFSKWSDGIMPLQSLDDAVLEACDYFLLLDRDGDEPVEYIRQDDSHEGRASFGSWKLSPDGSLSITQGQGTRNYFEEKGNSVQIAVFDRYSGEEVCALSFPF